MNIVMIGPFGLRPKGTMAVRALPLARALSERGHSVSLVLPPWSCAEDSGRFYDDGGVHIINIALPRRVPGEWHLVVAWRLLRAALAQRPDVVHCFKPKAYSGLAALLLWLARKMGGASARLVVDEDDWEGRGGWNDIERYSAAQKAVFAWQEQWGLRHADAVTVASRALQTIVWSMGIPPAATFYMPNGVAGAPETDATGEQSRRCETSPAIVLLYTRFFECAVERAASILAGVLAAAPQARAVIVGKGLFGEEQRFLAAMSAAGFSERVTYAGWREPSELPGHFAAATVAIYPFDDTLINRTKCAVKLTELLAAGVPVVADRVGQNAEYIEDNVSGLLVEAGDTHGFVAAVVALLGDAPRRQALSEGARRRMSERFSWSRLAGVAEDAYARQMDLRSRRDPNNI
jgi:glycosyltransferase involved in cell wall biosynthesis